MKLFRIAGLSLLIAVAGCGDSGPESDSAATRSAQGNPFVGEIDAGTSFVFANLERLPEDLVDRYWTVNEAGADSMRQIMEKTAADPELPAAARALIEEFSKLATREGWEAAGLHVNPYYVVHGVDLMPFASIELGDGAAFEALIGRVEARLDQPLTRRTVEGIEFIWFEISPKFGIALRHDDRRASVALIPDDATLLARFVGKTGPTDALSAESLAEFAESAGFTRHGSGYVDWQRMVERLLAGDTAFDSLIDEQHAAEWNRVRENPACVAEYRAVTAALPRMSMGYTRLDEDGTGFVVRQETSAGLGAQLAPIARVPVALDRELTSLFQFGFALDLVKARDFARELVSGWAANPPQCPSFAELAANAAEWQQALNRPVPPLVTNLQGMFVQANQLALENGMPVGGGTLTVFMHNPQLLVGMAQAFSPAVAELGLEPGAEPQPVPPGTIPQLDQASLKGWLGMGENALGLAVGEDNIDALRQSLAATESDPLIFSLAYNFDALLELVEMAQGVVAPLAGEGSADALELQKAQYQALAAIYEQAGFTIGLTERGIEFSATATLK